MRTVGVLALRLQTPSLYAFFCLSAPSGIHFTSTSTSSMLPAASPPTESIAASPPPRSHLTPSVTTRRFVASRLCDAVTRFQKYTPVLVHLSSCSNPFPVTLTQMMSIFVAYLRTLASFNIASIYIIASPCLWRDAIPLDDSDEPSFRLCSADARPQSFPARAQLQNPAPLVCACFQPLNAYSTSLDPLRVKTGYGLGQSHHSPLTYTRDACPFSQSLSHLRINVVPFPFPGALSL